jgi:multidrug efflux pump subunit AcrB
MTSFFKFFVHRHMFANILTASFILLGLAVLPSINRDTFPSVELDEVVVVTRYNGSSPEDIELKITDKIESELKQIDGIKRFTSLSIENVSLIGIVISPDNDDKKKVKDDIRQKIDSISNFPSDLQNRPTITEINSSTFPILEIGIGSTDLPYKEVRTIAKLFKNDLENISGVLQVDGYGYLNNQVKIMPSPDMLEKYQVSLINLIGIISNRNIRSSMGSISINNNESTIVNDSRLMTVEDIQNAIVRSNFNGQSIKVSDVSTVAFDFETPRTMSRISGTDGISFSIVKSGNADIIDVSNKIEALVKSYQSQYPNLTFITANDFSKYLKNRLNVMISNGFIGLVLVILVLTFFLNREMAFWVSLGIPISVMGVFFLMPAFNMTINIISLLALIIVIGIIVDDGIIVAENIAKFREKGYSNTEASIKGIQSVFKPVFTTILTTIVAFSPMFFMSGIMGKFIFQIPMVITLALIISLIEVLIALPSHLATKKSPEKIVLKPRHLLIKKARNMYEVILRGFLKQKYKVVFGFAIAFVGSIIFSIKFMNFVLFPETSAVNFFIRTEAPAGTPLKKTAELMRPIEAALSKLPKSELLSFTTRIGITGDSFLLTEQENLGLIVVDLVPFSDRSRSARKIMEEIKKQTKNSPGFSKISYQVDAGGPPVGKAVNIKIVSNDNSKRNKVANDIFEFVGSIDGVESVERDDKSQKKQINLNFDYDTISRLGLTISAVQQTVRTAFSGFIASTIRYQDEDIDFNIEFSPSDQQDINSLKNLLIPNDKGRLIRLNDIATLSSTDGSPNFTHFNGKRTITITGDIDKKVITSTALSKKVMAAFPAEQMPGVSLSFGGESEETNKSMQDLIRSFLLAIVGIFFLLILLFNSLTQPFLVLLTIPFGLIGVIIAFALHGQDLGFISMVGTVGLTGVVVNDSLVLVDHLNKIIRESNAEQKEDMSFMIQEIAKGSGDRFRPILITSCTTVAGLLPLAYGLGGADPFIAPMALAIGYGLLFSTPLTLFLLPALYLILIDISQLKNRIKHKLKKSSIPAR